MQADSAATAFECAICHERWTQIDGRDPQRHREGCPNAKPEGRSVTREGMPDQGTFAERLGGCTDPLLKEIDVVLRECWDARRAYIEDGGPL